METGACTRPEAREIGDAAGKVARSTMIRGQEGASEHRGVCYDPSDPLAFSSPAEVDAYLDAARRG